MAMKKITSHFSWWEFRSPDLRVRHKDDAMHDIPISVRMHQRGVTRTAAPRINVQGIAEHLEVVRRACGGRPITIVSGWRSVEYNRRNKGRATWSRHLFGAAADIRVRGMGPASVFWIVDELMRAGGIPRGGLAAYPTFVHIDVRGWMARWRKSPHRNGAKR